MSFSESTQLLLKAKKEKGLTFADIGNLLGLDEVWVASLFYGQSTASDEEADKLLTTLGPVSYTHLTLPTIYSV